MTPADLFAAALPARARDVLDAVLDAVAALVVVLDRGGRVVRFNRACERLTGYTESELLGRPIWDVLIPPGERAGVVTVFESLRAGMFPSTFRNHWQSRSGELHPIAWSNTALLDDAGGVEFVIATGIDLTRQVEADALADALRMSEARYSGIVSIAADAIIAIREDQRIILFNEGAQEIFGWKAEEVVGQPLEMLIPQRFRREHGRRHVPAFAGSGVTARRMGERREIFGLRKNGEEFPAEASISSLEVGGERILTVVLRDVTERKRLESSQRFLIEAGLALSSSLEYGSTLRRVARLAVQQLADFCIVDLINPAGLAERLESAHRDPQMEDIARALRDIPLDRSRPHLASEVLATGRPWLAPEFGEDLVQRMAQTDAHLALLRRLRPVSCMAVPLAVRDRLLGAIVLVSSSRRLGPEDLDIAEELARRAAMAIEHARLFQEAQRAIQARDEVVSIVAHDLGNPISAIRIGTALLARGIDSGLDLESAHARIAAIRHSTEQMERLVANLLDLRRIESGRLNLDRRPHAPAAVLESLRRQFELLASDRDIAFTVEVRKSAPDEVDADPDRILQVLENLVGNAFKFTPEGGTVNVLVSGIDGAARFEVRDTGPGIPADQVPHLFDRFWQAARPGRKGVGLGLFIAHGIVHAHGGRIWVESRPPNGATFVFTVPVRTPDHAIGAVNLT